VRLVPFAPFVLINITAGVTSMSWWAFLIGTGLGILPKIVVIAFAGQSVMAGGAWIWLALALGVWLAAGLAARRWLAR
ncbi:MAG TPA: VTT domain-containing protein, partial [Caulobacteraceae bacterium]|nr:VTT domain-containing protein [Caulobacteraceae bacterium]